MNKLPIVITLSAMLLLGACNSDKETVEGGSTNDGEAANEYGAIDHGVEDKGVGFTVEDGTIEEASGVPVEEKDQLVEALNQYIETANEQDIDGYLATLSDENFDIEEERAFMEDIFSEYTVVKEVSNITITKYSETEAHLFSEVTTTSKLLNSEEETISAGRQVTVFVKEEDVWKVASLSYIGNPE